MQKWILEGLKGVQSNCCAQTFQMNSYIKRMKELSLPFLILGELL